MNTPGKEIERYLRAHADEMFADLKYLVSFPSVKGEPEPGAPYGRNCAECLRAAADLYRKNGFEAEVYDERGYALAYLRNKPEAGEKYTGVFAHSDVVPVTAADWIKTDDPFRMEDLGDLVVGRGVSDNKSAVIGMLYILKAIRDLQIQLGHGITVFIGAEEESGMTDVRHFKQDQPLPAVSVVPDGSFPVSFGERGSFRARVISSEPLTDILSISGGTAYNTVLGTLSCEIRDIPGLSEFLISEPREWLSFEKTESGNLLLSVKGVSCHGGRPQHGESALKRMAQLLSGFAGFGGSDGKILREVGEILDDCWGEKLGVAANDPDMGRLTIANGMVWCEDGHLVLTFDCRFGPSVNKDEKKAQMGALLEARGFDFKPAKGGNSFRIDPENPLAKAFLASYRKYSGNPEASYYYMSGGTYSKILNPESISFSTGVTYGAFVSRLGLGAGHGKAHEADEVLGKEEYIVGLSILGGILADLDEAY